MNYSESSDSKATMPGKHTRNRGYLPKMIIGVVLLLAAGIGVAYPLWWNHRSSQGAASILKHDGTQLKKSIQTQSSGASCTATPGPGVLEIPSLSLTAPVQQGLDDAVLNVSIGHDPATSWPGPSSAALFAAHDVSFFSHLNQLAPGDVITYTVPCATYTFKVEGAQVTSPGAAISVPKQGAIVLDTCYPPNALWYTPDRYVVTATYVATQPQSATVTKLLQEKPTAPTSYNFSIPTGLSPQELQLSNNTQEMGQLSFKGTPTTTFQQSNNPLQIEGTGLQGWFAVLHSLEANQPSWWRTFAPYVAFPTGYAGQTLKSTSALQITETIAGTTPTAITLTGGENSWTFTVNESISHGTMTVTGFSVTT